MFHTKIKNMIKVKLLGIAFLTFTENEVDYALERDQVVEVPETDYVQSLIAQNLLEVVTEAPAKTPKTPKTDE